MNVSKHGKIIFNKNLIWICWHKMYLKGGFCISELIEYGIFGEGVSYFKQSEARKHCFLAFDWLKYETLPRKYHTLVVNELQ